MEKKKVAIVTLGDSRREFYKKREAIVASEIEKVKKAFGDKYDLYISPIVFDTEDGQNISDEIKKQGIEAVIIHVPNLGNPIFSIPHCLWNFLSGVAVRKFAAQYVQPCNTVGSWGYVGPDRKEVYPCIR